MDKKVLGREKALANPWRGYREPRTWGTWFAIQWPDVHPDTHCEAGQYTPDEKTRVCTSCGWVPVDAIHCDKCKMALRDYAELKYIERKVNHSHVSNTRALVVGYQAYVDKHRKQLIGPPEFEDVATWWNNLPTKTINTFNDKYYEPDSDLMDLLRELTYIL